MIERFKQESGYSLIEVVASILLLSIAIIPMVGMFDMGLRTATASGHYDEARALADGNLEKVRALPYPDAQAAYEPTNALITATNPSAGTAVSCTPPPPSRFTCSVTTTYVNNSFVNDPAATTRMRAVVTVTWDGTGYTTTGLISQ